MDESVKSLIRQLRQNPHDTYAKELLKDEEVAQVLLEAHLPQEIKSIIKKETLEVINTENLDYKEKSKYFADIIYSLKTIDGEDLKIYVLIEHKSYDDKHLPFQLIKNMTAIWSKEVIEGRITPIYPIVIYASNQKLTLKSEFSNYYKIPENLKKFFLNFSISILNLNELDEKTIKEKYRNIYTLIMALRIIQEPTPENILNLIKSIETLYNYKPKAVYVIALSYIFTIAKKDKNTYIKVKKQLEGG